MAGRNIAKGVGVITRFVKNHPVTFSGALVLGVCSYAFGKDIKQRSFVWVNKKAQGLKDERYEALRMRFLEPLKEQKSHDPQLQKENAIRILEVGVGMGINLKYYPEGCHLILVDPNPHFAQYYTEEITSSFKIKPEDIIVSTGEAMDMVESNSVDVVVVSLVFCSVTDVAQVAKQINRVLAPGGKFVFMEHVREWDTKKYGHRLFIQNFLTWSRLWPFLFEGCCLNRDPLPAIKASGFSEVQAEYFYAPIVYKVMQFVSPHLIGVATK